jgi:hypothetical protein
MSGAVAIVVALVLFPVAFLMGMGALAAILGSILGKDAETLHEDHPLLDLNV